MSSGLLSTKLHCCPEGLYPTGPEGSINSPKALGLEVLWHVLSYYFLLWSSSSSRGRSQPTNYFLELQTLQASSDDTMWHNIHPPKGIWSLIAPEVTLRVGELLEVMPRAMQRGDEDISFMYRAFRKHQVHIHWNKFLSVIPSDTSQVTMPTSKKLQGLYLSIRRENKRHEICGIILFPTQCHRVRLQGPQFSPWNILIIHSINIYWALIILLEKQPQSVLGEFTA